MASITVLKSCASCFLLHAQGTRSEACVVNSLVDTSVVRRQPWPLAPECCRLSASAAYLKEVRDDGNHGPAARCSAE